MLAATWRRPTSTRSGFHSPSEFGDRSISRRRPVRADSRHGRRIVQHRNQMQNLARITDAGLSQNHRQQQSRQQLQNERSRNRQPLAFSAGRGDANFRSPKMQTGHQQRGETSMKQVDGQDRRQRQ
jgi:hypothetical protein